MSAFDPLPAMSALTSYLKSRGRVRDVQLGEPEAPPMGRIVGAVFIDRIATPETVLDAPRRLYELTLRLYRGYSKGGDPVEEEMASVVSAVMGDLDADTTLDGRVFGVDVGGAKSGGLFVELAYLQIDKARYRIADINVPILVDLPAGSLRQ